MIKLLKNKSRILSLFLFTMLLFGLNRSYAASSFSTSASTTTIEVGGTANISVTGTELIGKLNVSTSNSSIASINKTAIFLDATDSFVITGNASGTVTITISPSSISDTSPSANDITNSIASKTITITVKEKSTNSGTTTNTGTTTTTSNANANLKKLVPNYEGLSPNFSPEVTKYSLAVPSTATSLGLTVQVEQAGAKYWITGDENLKLGDNTVTITVTAINGTKKTYTIIVTRADNTQKANAYLNNLIVDGKNLSPAFSSETFDYTIEDLTADVGSLNVLAYAKSDKAKVEITGNDKLVGGENTINIKVTAEDGVTTKNYTIKVKKPEVIATVDTPDKTVQTTDESNPYTEVADAKKSVIFSMSDEVRRSALEILLVAVTLIEFAQLVYLYHENRKLKLATLVIREKEVAPDIDKDKYQEARRRARATVSESLNSIGISEPTSTEVINENTSKIDDEKLELTEKENANTEIDTFDNDEEETYTDEVDKNTDFDDDQDDENL